MIACMLLLRLFLVYYDVDEDVQGVDVRGDGSRRSKVLDCVGV